MAFEILKIRCAIDSKIKKGHKKIRYFPEWRMKIYGWEDAIYQKNGLTKYGGTLVIWLHKGMVYELY